MKRLITLAILLMASPALAQSTGGATTITARTAAGADAEYAYAEALHEYSNGLLTGVGYVGTDTPNDNREGYAGVGYTFNVAGVKVLAVGYFDQTGGKETDAQTSVLPWLLATRTVGRVVGTANYFSYTPVGDGADTLYVVEHAKAEYRLAARVLGGVGYAGVKSGSGPWSHRPFVTGTYQSSIGDFEIWVQRRPEAGDDAAVQVRYKRVIGR